MVWNSFIFRRNNKGALAPSVFDEGQKILFKEEYIF